MAGMGDNPLIGDYTKGISKGREYFVALDRRIKREKADPVLIVIDLQMGLFQVADRMRETSILASGRGRFGPVSVAKQAPVIVQKQRAPKWKKVNLAELKLHIKQ